MCVPSHFSRGWTSLSALQTLAQDPPLLVGAAGCGEAAGETGLGLGDLVWVSQEKKSPCSVVLSNLL